MSLDEGVIKFDFSAYKKTDSVNYSHYECIEPFRKKMFDLNLIGFYEDHQVGYGNISLRVDLKELHSTQKAQFIISGTQTGHIPDLLVTHYTYVVDYKIEENQATSVGPMLPSSESLTHAAIYSSDFSIGAIIHIHNKEIWKGMIAGGQKFTEDHIPYGTVMMAKRVEKLIHDYPGESFAMAGHEDGVIIYGASMEEAQNKTIKLYQKYYSHL